MARKPISRNTKIMIFVIVAFIAFVIGILAGMQNRAQRSGDHAVPNPTVAISSSEWSSGDIAAVR